MIDIISKFEKLIHMPEGENLEFKKTSAKGKIYRYCAALANEGGGYLIYGVTDAIPRKVVGTKVYSTEKSFHILKKNICSIVGIDVKIHVLKYNGKRVIMFEIPSRAVGCPISLNSGYWMRNGEHLVMMPSKRLKQILSESISDHQLYFPEDTLIKYPVFQEHQSPADAHAIH